MNAIYPGSFDPITIGHLDIIKRAAEIFDNLYILAIDNSNKKNSCLNIGFRDELIKEVCKDFSNVTLCPNNFKISDTTPEIMEKNNIKYIVRGVRNGIDAMYEQSLYEDYKKINPNIDEIIFWSNINVSSSFVRECIKYNKWNLVKQYVPEVMYDRLEHYFHG